MSPSALQSRKRHVVRARIASPRDRTSPCRTGSPQPSNLERIKRISGQQRVANVPVTLPTRDGTSNTTSVRTILVRAGIRLEQDHRGGQDEQRRNEDDPDGLGAQRLARGQQPRDTMPRYLSVTAKRLSERSRPPSGSRPRRSCRRWARTSRAGRASTEANQQVATRLAERPAPSWRAQP